MSEKPTLFMDVDEIALKGSHAESMWGSPVDITCDSDIKDWVHGLREDGGAGCVPYSFRRLLDVAHAISPRNVLKVRKQEALARAAELARLDQLPKTTAIETHVQAKLDDMNVKVRVGRKSGVRKPRTSAVTPEELNGAKEVVIDKEALRRATWKVGGQELWASMTASLMENSAFTPGSLSIFAPLT